MNTSCDGVDFSLFWTYYKNEKSNTASVPSKNAESVTDAGTELIQSYWATNASPSDGSYSSAKATWQFRLNSFDFEMGRRYWLSRCFTLRPFLNLKGAWTETKLDLNLQGKFPGEGMEDGILHLAEESYKNNYWGAGIGGGIQATFYVTTEFSFYSSFKYDLLWSKFKGKVDENTLEAKTDPNDLNTIVAINRELMVTPKWEEYGMQPIVESSLGIRYESRFCCDRYQLTIDAGWEHQYLASHNRRQGVERFLEFSEHDIGFGGFVLRARFDF